MEKGKYDFASEMDSDLLLAHSATSEAWLVKMADAALLSEKDRAQ